MKFQRAEESAQCRAGRHASCMRNADECICGCHDSTAAAAKALGPDAVRAAVEEMRAPGVVDVMCPVTGCASGPYASEHAVRIHFARMHKEMTWGDPARLGEIIDVALPPDQDFPDVPSPAEYLEEELREIVARREEDVRDITHEPQPDPFPPQTTRVVHLAGGGTVTLTVSVDLFALSGADRTFLFALLDEVHHYMVREG